MIKMFLTASLIALLTGCAPRGETLTLEQVLDISKKRMAAAEVSLSGSIPQGVSDLKMSLESALVDSEKEGGNVGGTFVKIGDTLGALIPHAAITSRAALNELATQYKELGTAGKITPDQVKLLVSRTYHAVASELETTRFAL